MASCRAYRVCPAMEFPLVIGAAIADHRPRAGLFSAVRLLACSVPAYLREGVPRDTLRAADFHVHAGQHAGERVAIVIGARDGESRRQAAWVLRGQRLD